MSDKDISPGDIRTHLKIVIQVMTMLT